MLDKYTIDKLIKEYKEANPSRPYDRGFIRIAEIDMHMLANWLNLPEGFRVDHVEWDLYRSCILLRITGPEEYWEELLPGNHYMTITATCKVTTKYVPEYGEYFVSEKCYWPELGQSMPDE